jgi:hypothetical protein
MAGETRMYAFEFRGRAEVVRPAQGLEPAPDDSTIVANLNDNSVLIAQSMQGELTRGLSPSWTPTYTPSITTFPTSTPTPTLTPFP